MNEKNAMGGSMKNKFPTDFKQQKSTHLYVRNLFLTAHINKNEYRKGREEK